MAGWLAGFGRLRLRSRVCLSVWLAGWLAACATPVAGMLSSTCMVKSGETAVAHHTCLGPGLGVGVGVGAGLRVRAKVRAGARVRNRVRVRVRVASHTASVRPDEVEKASSQAHLV